MRRTYEQRTPYSPGGKICLRTTKERCKGEAQQRLESDLATFTHAKPSSKLKVVQGGGLANSAVTDSIRSSMRGALAGQDYAIVLLPVPGDVTQQIIVICDGHGEYGELFSVLAGEFICTKLTSSWDKLKASCHAWPHTSCATELMKAVMREAECMLLAEMASYAGGTTATVCAIVDGLFVVTANVGDTPAMLVHHDKSYAMLTTAHSADSPEEYTRYTRRCQGAGVQAHDFVYSRFNYRGGSSLPGPDGMGAPIPIFTLDDNQEAIPIEANAAYMATLGYHGGIQTARKHVERNALTGEIIGTRKDHRHENWGSTVDGGPQNTRSLGDFNDKRRLYLDAEASVSIVQLDRTKPCWLMVGSDGVLDAHWFEDVAAQIVTRHNQGEVSAQALCQGLIGDTLANAKQHAFLFKDDLPAWDDLSTTLVALPAVPCTAETGSSCEGGMRKVETQPSCEETEGWGPMRRTRSPRFCEMKTAPSEPKLGRHKLHGHSSVVAAAMA